jgi:cytoskeletal protein RodZ
MAIGQKLEEARNRKGISLREASESTKIRGDYLTAFESSRFDINLPEVYLRGFVRLYARFLDLDQEAVLADLDLELGNTNSKSTKKSLGSISSNESDSSEFSSTASTSNPVNKGSSNTLRKPIILALSILILIIIVISFLIAVSGGDKEEKMPPVQPVSESSVKETNVNSESRKANDNIPKTYVLKLAAIGPISLLIVDDQGNGTPIDYKDLEAGWENEITITKSFRCHCSDLENLRFAIDEGKEKKVDGVGAGNFSWNP